MRPSRTFRWPFLLLLAATALALGKDGEKKPVVGDTEPPLEFSLEVEDQTVPISPDQTVKVTIDGKEVGIKLIAKPDRLLKLPGISFRYPSGNGFETHKASPQITNWTLSGQRSMIILTRAADVADSDLLVQSTADQLVSSFGKGNVTRSTGELSLGGAKCATTDLNITLLDQHLVQRVVGVKSKKGCYVIILQDRPNKDGSISEGEAQTEKLLDDTFTLE